MKKAILILFAILLSEILNAQIFPIDMPYLSSQGEAPEKVMSVEFTHEFECLGTDGKINFEIIREQNSVTDQYSRTYDVFLRVLMKNPHGLTLADGIDFTYQRKINDTEEKEKNIFYYNPKKETVRITWMHSIDSIGMKIYLGKAKHGDIKDDFDMDVICSEDTSNNIVTEFINETSNKNTLNSLTDNNNDQSILGMDNLNDEFLVGEWEIELFVYEKITSAPTFMEVNKYENGQSNVKMKCEDPYTHITSESEKTYANTPAKIVLIFKADYSYRDFDERNGIPKEDKILINESNWEIIDNYLKLNNKYEYITDNNKYNTDQIISIEIKKIENEVLYGKIIYQTKSVAPNNFWYNVTIEGEFRMNKLIK